MYNKYLPLGTVVLLKGGEKRLMITGFCCVNENKTFDYTGCLYPEGFIGVDKILLFNHDQIEKIYALGFSDEEEKTFKQKLDSFTNEINSQGGLQNLVNQQANTQNNVVNGVEQVNLEG